MHLAEAWHLLELSPSPTVEQVKAAYRRRAKSLHPDLSSSNRRTADPALFARLTAAYEAALGEAVAANRHGPRPVETPPRSTSAQRTAPAPVRRRREGAQTRGVTAAPLRATPGSTTYPDEPYAGDPVWDGAGWVGPNSGTYWTVNPKEYADPRRHGPEYRARGRRPVRRDPRNMRSTDRSSTSDAGSREGAGATEESDASGGTKRPGLLARIAAMLFRGVRSGNE